MELTVSEQASILFTETYGNTPTVLVMAPGRVNLIGEHTDYQNGFVCPLALEKYTSIAASFQATDTTNQAFSQVRCTSKDFATGFFTVTTQMKPLPHDDPASWMNYLMGVFDNYLPLFQAMSISVDINLAIVSDVPFGSGLSSSAALETAMAKMLEAILRLQSWRKGTWDKNICSTNDFNIVKNTLNKNLNGDTNQCQEILQTLSTSNSMNSVATSLRCQKAEHVFGGVNCGIMDQYVSSCATINNAIMIDCQTLASYKVPVPSEIAIIVTKTNVKHSLGESAYNERVQECNDAVSILNQYMQMQTKLNKNSTCKKYTTLRDVENVQELTNAFNQCGHLLNTTTNGTTNDTTNDTTASKTNEILLICRDCTKQFEFTIKEQETYKQNGWTNKPGRCLTCRSLRAAKKLKTNTNNNNSNFKLQIDSEESTDSKVQNKIPRSNATGTRMGVVVALTTPSPLNDSQHLPSPLQQIQHKFSYDIKTYQFNLLLYQMFQLAKLPDGGYLPDLIDTNNFKQISRTLSQLHKTLEHFVGRTNSSPFHKAWKSIMSPSSPWKGFDGDCKFKSMENRQDLFHSFQQTLHQFVRTVVAKVLNCGPDDILYQRKPTLRVVVPSVKAVGHPHVDYDYHHQPGEINIWIPVTNVYGTNTLYSESKPGQKDFKPFVCNNGEAVSFWGNQCTHYTVPNETDVTRVSLDFRVIEKKRFNTNFVDSRGMETYFRVGEYYKDSAESVDGKEVDGGGGKEEEMEEEMEFLGSLMHEST